MKRCYRLYGLWLRSPWVLPAQERPAPGEIDVEFHEASAAAMQRAATEAAPQINPQSWFNHARLLDGADYARWGDLLECVVDAAGRNISCRALRGAGEDILQSYLLGHTLSFAMVRRGIEPLHATVIVVHGCGVIFMGDSHYGKSTLAAAFLAAGHRLSTDDVLVLQKHQGRMVAFPGPPRIKLYPEIARRVLGEEARGAPMNPLSDKLVFALTGAQACEDEIAAEAIYVLSSPAEDRNIGQIRIRSISAADGMVELLKNTFNPVLDDRARLKQQFLAASEITAHIPVRSLSYPRRLDHLSRLRDAVIADLRDRMAWPAVVSATLQALPVI